MDKMLPESGKFTKARLCHLKKEKNVANDRKGNVNELKQGIKWYLRSQNNTLSLPALFPAKNKQLGNKLFKRIYVSLPLCVSILRATGHQCHFSHATNIYFFTLH